MNHDAPLRGEIRQAGFRRISHGLYQPMRRGLDQHTETLRDLAAWRLVLPPDAVFTHVTAAELYGWWLPRMPEFVPVFAAADLKSNRPRRPGLIVSRLDREGAPLTRSDLPVDSAEEVLLRAARDLGLLDLVVMLDSALRLEDVHPPALAEVCASRRPGVRRLRVACSVADGRSESPWETLLRLFHVLAGVDVLPQQNLLDDAGRFVARADLLVCGTNFVHEYDGGHHLDKAQQGRDLRRARRLLETPYVRRGYTGDDLLRQPLVTLQELDRALGRPHRPGRLGPWRRWVADSTHSSAGRRRLQNRWLKVNGIADWSQTA